MNTAVTSREEILSQCRKIVIEQGLSAINMRTVAAKCGAAVGSIYNYFPSKAELVGAVVADVWEDIFHMPGAAPEFQKFTEAILWLFESMKKGCVKYPGFFTLHSVSFASEDKRQGKQLMDQHFAHMKQKLIMILKHDRGVRQDAFDGVLTMEEIVNMVLTLLISMLLQEQEDCGPLLEMVARCIYWRNPYGAE